MIINYDNYDRAVEDFRQQGVNFFEENWTLFFLNPDPGAETSKHGIFMNGEWGYPTIVGPNSRGEWVVPSRFGRS